jgi:hypothetical protein
MDIEGTSGVLAGDVDAKLTTHTNRTDNPHSATAAQVGAVATNDARYLAALTNVPTLQSVVNAGNTATGIGDLTIAGRVVSGLGLDVTNIAANADGAHQAGWNNGGTMAIGSYAYGARQAGHNIVGTMTVDGDAYGAQQLGLNAGTMTISEDASGAQQAGWNIGTMTIGNWAQGSQQAGWNNETMTIGNWAHGAQQAGFNNAGTMAIGINAYGASQFAYNNDTMTIGDYASGAQQDGWNIGTMTIGNWAHGAQQAGGCFGTMTIGDNAVGAQQRLFLTSSGSERAIIGNYCYGASQFGYLYNAAATNDAIGAMQLLNLSAGQSAWITPDGSASIGLGACVVSNKHSIVAGDGQQSHGNNSITAGGGFFSGETPVVTNYAATPFDAPATIANTSPITVTSYFGHAYSRTFTSTGTITHVFLGTNGAAGNEIYMETTATGLPARVWPAGYVFGYAGSISSNAPSPSPWAQMSVQKTPMGSIVWCVTGQVWQAGTP